MKDERTLVEGCLNNDRVSQRTLYERFAGRMFAVCQRYTRSKFEAEDVMQEGFVKVFSQIHTFRNDCPLDAWIKRIMINTAISYLRKEKAYLDQANIEDHTEQVVNTETALSGMEYQQLLAMVRELPLGCQSVFNLYAIEGYQHNEIATLLGISEGTSKSQYARAKQILQAKVLGNRKTTNNLN